MDTSSVAAPATPADHDDPTIWRTDDAPWALLKPVLKSDKVRKKPGRPRRDGPAIFDGLIWLAGTGGQWASFPSEFGPTSTVHRRFTEWVASGALERAWAVLVCEYDGEIGLDGTWHAADEGIIKTPFGKQGGLGRSRPPAPTRATGANLAPNSII